MVPLKSNGITQNNRVGKDSWLVRILWLRMSRMVVEVQQWLWLQCSDGFGCSAVRGAEVKRCECDAK